MVYEKGVKGKLFLELDQSSVSAIQQQLQGSASIGGGGSPSAPSVSGGGEDAVSTQVDLLKKNNESSEEVAKGVKDSADGLEGLNDKQEEGNDLSKGLSTGISAVSSAMTAGFNVAVGIVSLGIDIIQKLFNMVRDSSPLLQEILSWFNLAITLFLMPIGTAIAIELMPIMRNLLTRVIEAQAVLWDAYESGGISDMIVTAIELAFPIFFEAIYGAISILPDTGILGAIKSILLFIFGFIERHGEAFVMGILHMTEFLLSIVTNLPVFFAIIGGFLGTLISLNIAQIGLQITQIMTTASSGGFLGTGIGVSYAVAGIGIAGALGGIALGAMGGAAMMAEGGYVPATPGGTPIIAGEGGEGEFIVPRSKAGEFARGVGAGGGGDTFNFYGVTSEDMVQEVVRIVDRRNALSTTRGTF